MTGIKIFWLVALSALVLSACDGEPAPGTVLSSKTYGVPEELADAGVETVCFTLCPPPDGCSQCALITLPDSGPGVLCEQLECWPADAGPI